MSKRIFSILPLLLSTLSFACSGSSNASDIANAEPADNQQEEDLTGGVTRLASKLQDPGNLTALGDDVYFTTTYGYATQEEASYNHDIWIKSKTGNAKRLYKGLYGATWGLQATKKGLYEINEGYAAVVMYPLDGSNKDGTTLYHAIYGNDELPEVGVLALAADDDGLVLNVRTADNDPKNPDKVITLDAAGKNEKKLGTVKGTSSLKLDGKNVYVGTDAGDVFVTARDGSGSMKKISHVTGSVGSIAISGTDVFIGTDKGLYAQRKGTSAPETLASTGTGSLAVYNGSLLFGQYKVGMSSIPLAGGKTKLVYKSGAPSDILPTTGFVFMTDASTGRCHDEEEGQACVWEGAAYKIKM